MSGGDWNYFCSKMDEVCLRLEREKCPIRRALGQHLELASKAMHDIEWVDSGDMGQGEEEDAIRAVLDNRGQELRILKEDAEVLKCYVDDLLYRLNNHET